MKNHRFAEFREAKFLAKQDQSPQLLARLAKVGQLIGASVHPALIRAGNSY
jgi:hypothetical protein